jgi:hypothetical protein
MRLSGFSRLRAGAVPERRDNHRHRKASISSGAAMPCLHGIKPVEQRPELCLLMPCPARAGGGYRGSTRLSATAAGASDNIRTSVQIAC